MNNTESGSLTYQDDYGTIYENSWKLIDQEENIYDFTSITKQPFVWGEEKTGKVINFTVFRDGVCSISRQIIKVGSDEYEIIAEGFSQDRCTYQETDKYRKSARDIFKHMLNYIIYDTEESNISEGNAFTDPDDPLDTLFADVAPNGDIIAPPSTYYFDFVDVWGE